MKLAASLSLSFVLAASAATLAACGGTVEQPQSSASAVSKAPVGATTHGFVKVVGEALGEVPLRAEQRTELERLATEVDARHAAMAEGRKELALAIADQVERGTIDRAALQPKIDRVVADVEKARPDDRAAVARVHALLDADQRDAFVDALEARLGEMRRSRSKGFAEMKQLADDLKLTDEQRAQIREAFKGGQHARFGREHAGDQAREHRAKHKRPGHGRGHAPGHAMKGRFGHGHGRLEAFRADKLDLDRLAPTVDLKGAATAGTDRMIGFAEKVLPVLTPEQRKIAADRLRARAASGELGPLSH